MGTQRESQGWGWLSQCKHNRSTAGKSAVQSEGVMRTEVKVGKLVSELPRKAAIVLIVPVPQTDTGG